MITSTRNAVVSYFKYNGVVDVMYVDWLLKVRLWLNEYLHAGFDVWDADYLLKHIEKKKFN